MEKLKTTLNELEEIAKKNGFILSYSNVAKYDIETGIN